MSDKSTDLAILTTLTPAIVFAEGGVDAILAKIRSEVATVDVDISTAQGRKNCASLAYRVARSKTALDDMGKTLVAEWKSRSAIVDAERRRIRDELDALRDQVRKPLDDYEQAEKDRIEGHENALRALHDLGTYDDPELTLIEIDRRLTVLAEPDHRSWQEFHKRAEQSRTSSINMLTALRTSVIKRDADRAELERHRQEAAAREAKERDAQIAAEAAKRAREEAEARAIQEREAAEQRIRKAEIERDAAETEKALAAEKSRRDQIAAAQKAERDKQAAIEAERRRAAAETARQEAETAARERDRAHRKRINNEILVTLIKLGIATEPAKAIIIAIGRGDIPHTRIVY
jgi:hypothetical protein